MTSNKVINAQQQNKHIKNSYERCTYVNTLLKITNIYTKWCTDVTVRNSHSETRFIAMVHSI